MEVGAEVYVARPMAGAGGGYARTVRARSGYGHGDAGVAHKMHAHGDGTHCSDETFW